MPSQKYISLTFPISQMFFTGNEDIANIHSQLIQVVFRVSAWMFPPGTAMCLFFPSTQHTPWRLAITASGSQTSLHTNFPSLCEGVLTTLPIHHTILQTFLKKKVWLSLHPWYKSHLEITLRYHMQVCKEKANVILMNSEFIQLLNHRIQVLGWTFS